MQAHDGVDMRLWVPTERSLGVVEYPFYRTVGNREWDTINEKKIIRSRSCLRNNDNVMGNTVVERINIESVGEDEVFRNYRNLYK